LPDFEIDLVDPALDLRRDRHLVRGHQCADALEVTRHVFGLRDCGLDRCRRRRLEELRHHRRLISYS
jgi:hypothetical protein